MKIEHLTRKDYLTINPYSGINAIKKQLVENSALVVEDEDKFYGIITTNDIVQNPRTLIIDCLTIKTLIDSDFTVEQTLGLMNETHTDVLPVGKSEKIMGLVFKKDLFNYFAEYNTELENKIKERTQELEKAIMMKDIMFSVIAHDLRSPFNTILGFTELLIENIRKYDIEKTEKHLSSINSQAKNTYNLLDNLLNWAKSQTGQNAFNPVACNFSEICNVVIEQLKDSAKIKQISLNCFYSIDAFVYADKNMVETILRNIISNAIKFTEPNGDIDISTRLIHQFLEITISDTGIGLNENIKLNLFDLDFNNPQMGTANEKGTGLGLVLCKDFVEKNGGTIWVENKTGKGTEFKFTLPSYIGQDTKKEIGSA
jgi:signal transduction histidine kinase